ncbi:Uncharacterised protein [uncultured archaeon]|nr:Uncharacterised protein [uncultured archaeon]
MGDLEDRLKNVQSAEELIQKAAELRYIGENVAYLNQALPGQNLGDRLFDCIKKHAAELTQTEATKITEFAKLRIEEYVADGKYKKRKLEELNSDLDKLPEYVIEFKRDFASSDQNNTAIFLDFCRFNRIGIKLTEMKPCYGRFIKVKDFYSSVPEKFKDLPALRDRSYSGNWEEFRKSLHPDTNPEDKEELDWINKYEGMERDFEINFSDIATFIYHYQKKSSPQA